MNSSLPYYYCPLVTKGEEGISPFLSRFLDEKDPEHLGFQMGSGTEFFCCCCCFFKDKPASSAIPG